MGADGRRGLGGGRTRDAGVTRILRAAHHLDTHRAYAATVGDLKDRRAVKKAQTREHLRTVAQRMFAAGGFDAVTIADVAREADVAVQTVFNHFPTKEELFFEGRVPWVDGFAAAVRDRAPGESPLTALRACLVETVRDLVASHSTPERRCYIATLEVRWWISKDDAIRRLSAYWIKIFAILMSLGLRMTCSFFPPLSRISSLVRKFCREARSWAVLRTWFLPSTPGAPLTSALAAAIALPSPTSSALPTPW